MRWVPPVAGIVFVALFVSLGIWQLNRAIEKNAMRAAFMEADTYMELRSSSETVRFQPIRASGHYVPGKQIIIDNIVQNGRLGYYIITPFRATHHPALIGVNRGWVERDGNADSLPDVSVATDQRVVRGKVGGLPRVGIRPGPAFTDQSWPRLAVWPDLADLAAAWGESVAPEVLLLDPGEADGFVRSWEPPETGSLKHYSYAFQWFAMAIAVLAIMYWNVYRKRAGAVPRDHD